MYLPANAEQVEISKAHEILDEELEAEQSVAQPQVTVEELEQIRKDAFENRSCLKNPIERNKEHRSNKDLLIRYK